MGFTQVIHSEAVKTVSLKVPVYIALITTILVVGLSGLFTFLAKRSFDAGRPEEVAGIEPGIAFTMILQYGQIGVILFGSWLLFQEQTDGCLRTAMLATPSRVRLFFAKTIVAGTGSFIIATASILGTYTVRALALGNPPITPGGNEDTRVILGYIVYWTLLGILAFTISAIVRNGLIGLSILILAVLGISTYLRSLTPLARFLPDQAGAQIYQETPQIAADLGPILGLLTVCAWLTVAAIIGVTSFRAWAPRG